MDAINLKSSIIEAWSNEYPISSLKLKESELDLWYTISLESFSKLNLCEVAELLNDNDNVDFMSHAFGLKNVFLGSYFFAFILMIENESNYLEKSKDSFCASSSMVFVIIELLFDENIKLIKDIYNDLTSEQKCVVFNFFNYLIFIKDSLDSEDRSFFDEIMPLDVLL